MNPTEREACRKWHIVRLAKIIENDNLRPMACCVVSYLDEEGMRHTVEVDAGSLYEAAALAMRTFKQHDCAPAEMTTLEVEIRSSVTHTITPRKVHQWLNGGARSPKEAITKQRLRSLVLT